MPFVLLPGEDRVIETRVKSELCNLLRGFFLCFFGFLLPFIRGFLDRVNVHRFKAFDCLVRIG